MKNVDIERLGLLLWRELFILWKPIAIYVATSILLLIFREMNIGFISLSTCDMLFNTVTVGGSFLLSSRVMACLRTRRSCIHILTLPVSAVEFFTVRYLYLLMFSVFFTCGILMFKETVDLKEYFNMYEFCEQWGRTCVLVMIGSHIAMLGGAFFKKLAFVKTSVLFLFFLAMAVTILDKNHVYMNTTRVWMILVLLMIVSVSVGIAMSFRLFTHCTLKKFGS